MSIPEGAAVAFLGEDGLAASDLASTVLETGADAFPVTKEAGTDPRTLMKEG